MSKIHFFSDDDKLLTQTNEQSFGAKNDDGNLQTYNLQSVFTVDLDSPIYAITKAQLLYLTDQTDSSLLNVVLKPINAFTAGLPIKYIIIKGIRRNSVIDQEDKIIQDFSGWKTDNILKVIKSIQDKVNSKLGTDDVATSSSLGVQFSEQNTSTIDSIFYDNTDDFHPIIVSGGCEIGKAIGGDSKMAIQIIFDLVDSNPSILDARKFQSIFQIEKINLSIITDLKERKKAKFINRSNKESILKYLDITALYGLCRNQNFRVIGIDNNTYLDKFFNKNLVYIDVRDNYGYSYNHFLNFDDEFYRWQYNAVNELIFDVSSVYEEWPIITINNMEYQSNKKEFLASFPISEGAPEKNIFVTSFTGKVSTSKRKDKKRDKVLVNNDNNEISLSKLEPIKLSNWKYDDNKLGSNYHLLKISSAVADQDFVWNNYFSLKIKSCFNTLPAQAGEFYARVYNSINSPLVYDYKNDEAYFPIMGIAIDKLNYTFFCFKNEIILSRTNGINQNIISTGKYNIAYDDNDYDFSNATNYNIGFVNQLFNLDLDKEFKISKTQFLNQQDVNDENNNKQFLQLKALKATDSAEVFTSLKMITLTHEEYNHLMDIVATNDLSDNDYVANHAHFIKSKESYISEYPNFYLESTVLTLGIPKIEETSVANFDINTVDYPDDIIFNGTSISFDSISLKS